MTYFIGMHSPFIWDQNSIISKSIFIICMTCFFLLRKLDIFSDWNIVEYCSNHNNSSFWSGLDSGHHWICWCSENAVSTLLSRASPSIYLNEPLLCSGGWMLYRCQEVWVNISTVSQQPAITKATVFSHLANWRTEK